jgi:ABC-type uncharacterized transport system substrate-binding protein
VARERRGRSRHARSRPGNIERFADIAAEFVGLKVNVIVTSGTPAVMALQQATSVIPIVASNHNHVCY